MKNLTYKAFENSKNTSGETGNNPAGGNGQLTLAQKQELMTIAVAGGCTHILTHLPMDTNTQMVANYANYAVAYNRNTVEQEVQEWCSVIHAAGLKHVHRGTWSAIKGNNDFAFATYPAGTNYVPLGTVAGAAAEGETTYCGKMWRYLSVTVGPTNLADGDIIAPISESTEFLSNGNYKWFDDSVLGTQNALVNFFTTMRLVVLAYGTSIGKTLDFMTIHNLSEYKSGYLPNTNATETGHKAADYYGHPGSTQGNDVEPANRSADWAAIYSSGSKLFIGEFGLIFALTGVDNNASMPAINGPGRATGRIISSYEDACLYLMQMMAAMRNGVIDTAKMDGVSNWGLWSGQNSSIVTYSNGHYYLNYVGQVNQSFYRSGGMARVPVPDGNNSFRADLFGGRGIKFM